MTDAAGLLLFVYGGCTFKVVAGAQPPKAGSLLFCRHLPVRSGDRMLEIGSGIGLAAVLAARAGAHVIATDVLYASPGQLVTFTSYAANNGPSTSQLDAIVEGKVNLSVKRQRCQFVSPDTPSCEFGTFAPGKTARMQVRAQVTSSPGDHAALTVCTGSEGSSADPNPSNDCTTTGACMMSRSAFGNAAFGADVVKVVLSTAKAFPAARAVMTNASITGTMMRLITHPLSK